MGWREKMGVIQEKTLSETPIQKVQNIQKDEKKLKTRPFVPSVPFVVKNQEVKTLQEQINDLWSRADKLVDWIDDSNSTVPWQERAAKVPELQEMSLEIDKLKAKQKVIPKEISTSIDLNDFSPIFNPGRKAQIDMAFCPARCKQTGKCYGITYFDAKPGKSFLCMPDQCPWNDRFKQHSNKKPRQCHD